MFDDDRPRPEMFGLEALEAVLMHHLDGTSDVYDTGGGHYVGEFHAPGLTSVRVGPGFLLDGYPMVMLSEWSVVVLATADDDAPVVPEHLPDDVTQMGTLARIVAAQMCRTDGTPLPRADVLAIVAEYDHDDAVLPPGADGEPWS